MYPYITTCLHVQSCLEVIVPTRRLSFAMRASGSNQRTMAKTVPRMVFRQPFAYFLKLSLTPGIYLLQQKPSSIIFVPFFFPVFLLYQTPVRSQVCVKPPYFDVSVQRARKSGTSSLSNWSPKQQCRHVRDTREKYSGQVTQYLPKSNGVQQQVLN